MTDTIEKSKATKKRKPTTSKKTKVIGNKAYIDPETGESIACEVVSIEDRDFNFHKVWLGHIIQALDAVGNQKIKVITFLLDNMSKDNLIILSQREIAEKSNVSVAIVNQTVKALKEADFIVEVKRGLYQINPSAVFKGSHNGRLNVMYQYSTIATEVLSDETVNTESEKGE